MLLLVSGPLALSTVYFSEATNVNVSAVPALLVYGTLIVTFVKSSGLIVNFVPSPFLK